MEKHKCKLCFRKFSNGRALGGHMRSHILNNLPVPPKQQPKQPPTPPLVNLSFESDSTSSSSDEDEDKDPKFSFAVVESAFVIPQDRESETEEYSKKPTRRRSKRPWNKYNHLLHHHHHSHRDHKQTREQDRFMKLKSTNKLFNSNNNNNNTEPVSSIFDVAFCLMMLSRDKWKKQKDQEKEQYEEEEERSLEDSDEFSDELKSSKTRSVRGRYNYKCETCNKVFRSYQALGGHRASHKKIKVETVINESSSPYEAEMEQEKEKEKKIHECPVCFRVFTSGQALGGHKRIHVMSGSSSSAKFIDNNFIDLNLPAPIDDDDASQIENFSSTKRRMMMMIMNRI